ncbi:hypothetical protein GCM10011331_09840 [Flavimobilis marinus]|uniref:ATP-dependent helicase HrpA n=1 Tax=Flavimobilis marinus TaxID=285351 RepID=A0A1I2C8P9_9MICO|nr:DUF3418 domain-containing protein [Flavimobilis marinus]GHG48239.1 hypothetical protein GCM10011331_09840 [Flavimobilis marinus]SFE64729.1 ATP-dependent helicase HrpA [Flavimobilis marinus]
MSASEESRAQAGRGRRRRGPRKPRPQAGAPGRSRTDRGAPDRAALDARALARARRSAEARRAVVVPPIHYPPALPVSGSREEIAAAIRDHQVVIVAGATGSGKTTQIPKIALELGRGREGQIGHTQPRRIAARTVAERIAEELDAEHTLPDGTVQRGKLGGIVGYQVRFTDESSASTLVKVMTDGILLAQIQRDPLLRGYDTLIIDEAHERSLNIDFLLGYLTQLLPQRPDLKVVITSATIDSARFADHFASVDARTGERTPAPVIEVTGRTFPVEIRYRPLVPDAMGIGDDDDGAGAGPSSGGPSSGSAGKPKGKGAKGPKPPKAEPERDLMSAICEAVDELFAVGPGDVLVFLSGEREIRDAEDALRGHLGERVDGRGTPTSVEVVPLYSRLSAAEQHRVFQSHGGRRVVLATNVAETSLTVPGIRYVVDPGTARISRFSKATKVQRLPIEAISQASANQRSGRCGRVADGVAIRLYSEADFESRPEFTEPEILRTSLASVILQMVSAGVATGPDDVAKFPFVEAPDVRSIRDGVQLLTELGALRTAPTPTAPADGTERADDAAPAGPLTDVGRMLAQLPMDPRLARMIVEGARSGVGREVVIVTAALTIQDVRERPLEQRARADQLHARFADPSSDFLTYLNLWEYLKAARRELSSSAFRRLCKAEHINFLRVREWQDLVGQLKDMATSLGLEIKPATNKALVGEMRDPSAASDTRDARAGGVDPETTHRRLAWDGDSIHRALLAGMLSHLGMQQVTEIRIAPGKPTANDRRAAKMARNDYLGARGARFAIFPGSGVVKKPPAWIMAAELVETSRLWARDVARVQPEWAEELGAHLTRHVYSEPHWSTKQGAAQAYEKVLLYGLPIVAQRKVLFGKVDPEGARELFIRHALVQGEWTTHHEFFRANQQKIADVEALEARTRQRGLLADDEAIFAFYDARVPAEVVSARHFDTWWKTARRTTPELLTLTDDVLMPTGADVDEAGYPDTWHQGDLALPLTYQLTPGSDADGVTVHVPITVLSRLQPDGFDWMVPGMLAELTTAWIRALPKPVRVQLVPAPDVAREIAGWIVAHEPAWADVTLAGDMAPSFPEVFARAARALRDVVIPAEAFDASKLPSHLRMTFRVSDERGVVIDEGADLVALQRKHAGRAQTAVSSAVRSAVGTAMREAQEREAGSGRGRASGPQVVAPEHALPESPGSSATSSATDTPRSGEAAAASSTDHGAIAEQSGLTTWPDVVDLTGASVAGGEIPRAVSTVVGTGAGSVTVRGYPALVVEPGPPRGKARGAETVALRVLADADRQDAEHARGVGRLLLSEVALPVARVTTRWTGQQALTLAASPYRTTDDLVTDAQAAAVTALTSGAERGIPAAAAIRDAATYAAARSVVRERLEEEVYRIIGHVVAALTAYRTLEGEIRATTSLALLNTLTDLRDHAAALVFDGFISVMGPERLPHLTRYLRAASYRLDKAQSNPNRDAELAWRVHDVEAGYERARAAYAAGKPNPDRLAELAEVRWMLEEFRVSLFAQQLGTNGPVSEKRIRKVLGGW